MNRHSDCLRVNPHIVLLLIVTLVWGTTFPLLKIVSATLSGLEVSTLRFWAAGLVMLPFALQASRSAWRDGVLLSIIALLSYVAQAYGLELISSNRSAFITTLNVLMVPFLSLLFLRKALQSQVLIAAVLACLGIGLMSWGGEGNTLGDLATLGCAVAYACYTLLLSRAASKHPARALAATQIVLMAVFASIWLAMSASSSQLASLPTRAEPALPAILYLGLIATAAMLFIQAIGQRKVSAEQASLIYALEPVFAALFGWLWLSEAMSTQAILGGFMVLAAVLYSEYRPSQDLVAKQGQA